MRGAEQGFLLLSSNLGDPNRKPLTTAQLRLLADRSWMVDTTDPMRDLSPEDLEKMGIAPSLAQRILHLLSQTEELDYYIASAKRLGCSPLTRVSEKYPLLLRQRMGLDAPGVLWAKGNLQLLEKRKIAVVGSRELENANGDFAREVGRQAALQGYVVVSGNARGADRTAQTACLENGGQVICVVPDRLKSYGYHENILYLSEDSYDGEFTALRALSRNRVIHALGEKTFVCQSGSGKGGTWDGCVKNLRFGWSGLYCFRDGSPSMERLEQMGAQQIGQDQLSDFSKLQNPMKIDMV